MILSLKNCSVRNYTEDKITSPDIRFIDCIIKTTTHVSYFFTFCSNPVAIYGSETWHMTKADENELDGLPT